MLVNAVAIVTLGVHEHTILVQREDTQEWVFPSDWRQGDETIEQVAERALGNVVKATHQRVRLLRREPENLEEELLILYCYLEIEPLAHERATLLPFHPRGLITSLATAQELLTYQVDRRNLADAVTVWSDTEALIHSRDEETL